MDQERLEIAEFYASDTLRKARDTLAFMKAHEAPADTIRRFEWGERYFAEGLRQIELQKLEVAHG